MRQTAVMTKKLLLPFLSFFLFLNVASGQNLDEDGQLLLDASSNPVILECNNLDMGTFEANIEIAIQNYADNQGFNDSTNGPCPPDPSYDSGSSVIIANYNYTCGDEVEVEIDVTGCDANLDTWTVRLGVEDTQLPVDFTTDSSLDDPNVFAHACDFANTDQAITDWIDDIIDNGQSNGLTYFADNCNVDPTAFTITAQSTPVPLDYTTCVAGIYPVTFDVDDGCGSGPVQFTYEFEIVDDIAPTWMTIPDVTVDCDNLNGVDHQADFDQWVDDIITNVNGYAADGCDSDVVDSPMIIVDNTYTVTTDQCATPPTVWEQVVTFTVEDNCGLTSETTATYTIEDNSDPVWNTTFGDLDFIEEPCAFNQGTDHEANYITWADNIVATALNNGEVEDGCSNTDATLIITYMPMTIDIDYEMCLGDPFIHDETVTFTATDQCGNTATFEAIWQLEDMMDPVLGSLVGIQPVPVPECSDLDQIVVDLTTMLLSGVLTDDCTDFTNLAYEDFTIDPDPMSITSDDYEDGQATGSCYIIEFEITYEDPCGVVSNMETVFFEVDDFTAPILDGWEPFELVTTLVLDDQCPGQIQSEQDVKDIILANSGGEWDFDDPSLMENCADPVIVEITDSFFAEDCGQLGFIEWKFIDDCGNETILDDNGDPYRAEWTISDQGVMPLVWLIDPEDGSVFPPVEGIEIGYNDAFCTGEYDPCLWLDNDMSMYEWFAEEGVHWEGGCDVTVFYNFLPCSDAISDANNLQEPPQNPPIELIPAMTNSATTVNVCIDVIDACTGMGLQHCFDVTIECGTCDVEGDGGIYCEDCDTSNEAEADGGCKLCDPIDLAQGYTSCNPFCPPPCTPMGAPQPPVLCGEAGNVPHNMSWFSFIASSPSLDIQVELSDCTTDQGVQLGIYDSCDLDNCVVWFGGCVTTGADLSGSFNPGQTYYMFVDGCNGDDCVYTVQVVGLEFLGLPEMDAVTAYSECRDEVLSSNQNDPNYSGPQTSPLGDDSVCDINDAITVCPGETIEFSILHRGNPNNPVEIHQEECNNYSENLNSTFVWDVEWEGQIFHNPVDDGGGFIPPIEAPMVPGVYEVCLQFIEFECDPKIGPACISVHVVPIENETFINDVCIEQLDGTFDPDGWHPEEAGQDPNGDGFEWLGEYVTLTEVQGWPVSNSGPSEGYRCNQFMHIDPNCNCEVPQTLCIKVRGDEGKDPIELYMFQCQFEECSSPLDCDSEPYEWMWNWNNDTETFDLFNELDPSYTQAMCFRIDGYHEHLDNWRPQGEEYCDTIPEVTVFTRTPPILIEDMGCGTYTAGIDFDAIDDDDGWDNWPEIFDAGMEVEFLDCNTGISLGGANGMISLSTPNPNVCVRITYSFIDGAWWDWDEGDITHGSGQPQIETCSSSYGPFDWGQGSPAAPLASGDDTFCATDLDNHVWEIDNPVMGFTYLWNQDPVVPGVVINDISVAGDGSIVEVSLPAGWGASDCTNVVASAACGDSDPTAICFTLQAPPTVVVDPISDICITDAPDPSAATVANVTATATPAGGNYCYTWGNGGNSTVTTTNATTFNFASAGPQMVTVSVEDKDSGCSSLVSAAQSFEVMEPLATPIVSCGERGLDFVDFEWTMVPGATNYTVLVDGVAQTETGTDIRVPGLAFDQEVVVTVVANGGAPCFNSSESASQSCTTTDCPPDDVVQSFTGESLCVNDLALAPYNLNDAFDLTVTGGTMAYSSMPPSGPLSGDTFDPAIAAPGVYTITAAYTYGATNNCFSNFTIQYIMLPAPVADFMIESPICVNNSATVDASLITGTPTWDYQGGVESAGAIKWDAAGSYTVSVETNLGGCIETFEQVVVVEPALEAMVDEGCDSGLDFVVANWTDVPGANGYEVVITNTSTGMTTTETITVSEYQVNELNENDEIEFVITAISDIPGCESTIPISCTATACEQYPPLSFITPCDDGDGYVTFTWNAIAGIDEFIVTNLADNMSVTQTELDFTVTGLLPLEEATISVQPIHPTAGCEITPVESPPCAAPCPGIPEMSDVGCTDSSIDFVFFEWDDVSGIDGYEVTWSINGGMTTVDTIQDSELRFPGLEGEDEVEISVVALNPDQLCGNDDASEASCVASSCTQPVFTDPELVVCWEPADGPIQLSIGDVVDANGDPLSGDVYWLPSSVEETTGLFTPTNTTMSMEYSLRYRWEDREFPEDCQFTDNVIVQVYIKPTPDIEAFVEDVCVGDPAVLMGVESPDDEVEVTWDWDGGENTFGSWPDQLELTYDTPGIKTVTITETSSDDPLCATDVSVTFEVIDRENLNVFCKAVTNNSVTFGWDDFGGALGYNYSVDGGPSQLTPENEITVPTTGVGPVTIEVTGFFDPLRPCEVKGEAECTPGDCPPVTWDTNLDLGTYCPQELDESFGLMIPGAEVIQGGPNQQTPPFVIQTETWTGHPSVNATTGDIDRTLLEAGEVVNIQYAVDFIAADGSGEPCSYSESYTFEIFDSPSIDLIEINDPDCLKDEVPSITITASGGTEPYTYEWANNPPSQTESTYIISSPGDYTMIVTDANGCTAEGNIPVAPAPDPMVVISGPNQIFIGETESFEYVLDDLTLPVNSVVWYIDDIPVDLQPDQEIFEIVGDLDALGQSFDLRVEVYFSADCFIKSEILSIDITDIEKWYIPNVISTGAEGEDSSWNIYTKGNVVIQKLSIYDRWGELVFIKDLDPLVDASPVQGPDASGMKWDLGWSGLWGPAGAKVEQGVYVYVVDMIVDDRPEVEAGDITIYR